jgi:magnesium transporter
LNTIFVHRNGGTQPTTRVERSWLNPAAGATLWVNLQAPSIPESLLLSDTFAFHPLAVEDALSPGERPKIDPFEGYLFIVLTDLRMFVGQNFLVSVSGAGVAAVEETRDNVAHNPNLLADGSLALCHRLVDEMVDAYEPRVAAFGDRLDTAAGRLLGRPSNSLLKDLLALHAEVLLWNQRIAAEADVVGRLARREFIDISTEMAPRFRDVHDHLLTAGDRLTAVRERIGLAATVASGLAGDARRWI